MLQHMKARRARHSIMCESLSCLVCRDGKKASQGNSTNLRLSRKGNMQNRQEKQAKTMLQVQRVSILDYVDASWIQRCSLWSWCRVTEVSRRARLRCWDPLPSPSTAEWPRQEPAQPRNPKCSFSRRLGPSFVRCEAQGCHAPIISCIHVDIFRFQSLAALPSHRNLRLIAAADLQQQVHLPEARCCMKASLQHVILADGQLQA